MIFQEFDKNNRERIKALRERQKEAQSSSDVWHAQYTVDEERARANVHERGQEAKQLQETEKSPFGAFSKEGGEKDKESRMREVFHTENAFARISLGLNEKGESSFVVARKMRADEKSTERSERELDEQRSYNWHVVSGDDKANLNKPAESAFGFYQTGRGRLDPHTRARRMLAQSQEFANLTGNMMTEEFVPQRSLKAGDTKELTSRQLTLEHQLAIALERGEKKNEEKKDKEIIPVPKREEESKGKPKKDGDDTVPRPERRKYPPEEEDNWSGFPGGDSGYGGGSGGSSSGGAFSLLGRGAISARLSGADVWIKRKKFPAAKPKKPRKLGRIKGRQSRIKTGAAIEARRMQTGISGIRQPKSGDFSWLAFFAVPMVLKKEEEEKKKSKGKKTAEKKKTKK